jgi:3-hydroxyisobutyrate dehydrogenase/2-hydroxy-3-oxopropionate reductase
MTTVAFIGLGAMGAPMVGHLIRAGHTVRAFVRRPEAADAARQLGAEPFFTPAEAAQAAVVFTNVTSSEDARSAARPERRGGRRRARHDLRRPQHDLADRHARDRASAGSARHRGAGLSGIGRHGGAQAATLTIMVGGKAEVLEKVRPLLEQIGKTITHIGDSGAGQVAKLCNQIAQVVNIEGIAEAMRFAGAQGVDTAKVFQAMSTGMAGSRMLDMLGPKMVTRDFSAGIESRLHAKDFDSRQTSPPRSDLSCRRCAPRRHNSAS